jgi:hypothetical protein
MCESLPKALRLPGTLALSCIAATASVWVRYVLPFWGAFQPVKVIV